VTVRVAPQLSVPVKLPQFLPWREQKVAFDSAAQPQTFVVPPPPQVAGDEQVPQLVTVRIVPQLSLAVRLPQFLPWREQKAAFDSAAQVQTLAAQVWGAVQLPQFVTVRVVPQLSGPVKLPHALPWREQNTAFDSAAHAQTLAVQVWGAVQLPHVTVRIVPQLSLAVRLPQFLFWREQNAGLVSGTQLGPHTFATPPPAQVCGGVQLPQFATVRILPQLSFAVKLPQLLPVREQNAGSVSGVHGVPQTFGVPVPAQVCVPVHIPQLGTVRGALQLSVPVTAPQFFIRRAQKATSFSAGQIASRPASTGPPPPEPPPTPLPDAPPVVTELPLAPPPTPAPDVPPTVTEAPPEPPVAPEVVVPPVTPEPPVTPVPDVATEVTGAPPGPAGPAGPNPPPP
jgi:hypothetical protein